MVFSHESTVGATVILLLSLPPHINSWLLLRLLLRLLLLLFLLFLLLLPPVSCC
jgi:hypothetical protein